MITFTLQSINCQLLGVPPHPCFTDAKPTVQEGLETGTTPDPMLQSYVLSHPQIKK